MAQLASLSDKQADAYLDARPRYPAEWFRMLAARTPGHNVAWDVGTGNGHPAVGVAEYYEKVVATDINDSQLKRAIKHPRVAYHHTPASMPDDDLVSLVGGENSVDLIIAAQAVHYFDLGRFYNIARRVLKKPGGVIAVCVYNRLIVSPEVDPIMDRLVDSTLPFRNPTMNLAFDGYKTLPFPFESIGLGSEGNPVPFNIPHKLSLNGFLGFLRSWQPVVKAKEQGVELVTPTLLRQFQAAWGDQEQVKDVFYKAYMLAGKVPEGNMDKTRNRPSNVLVCNIL
ncbi:PREDICTED: putative methyltransferase DDB_G0268948 [Tarenaya hassleriana]|uniref:putative methyltransferase DDB_G0268948 n=1 Tax=Tarenaya hassleriana TaxID=28532 RepID=UPI00053C64D4|nr:PREDICTED: putative methyltransferase DDB_G0268948 [Tarenaya hassleriana]